MAYRSLQSILERAGLVTPVQFRDWSASWRTSLDAGGTETQLAFFAREAGLTEEQFLQKLSQALDWPFVELGKQNIETEIRKRISTKVAFQYSVFPVELRNGVLRVAAHNPFDPGMQAAVQFDAKKGDVVIDKDENLYVADSESESVSKNHDGWKRGIRVGKLKDGSVADY